MYNPRIKEKHSLVDLANYGTEARKNIHSRVLIGEYPVECPPFREGDILDANATLGLIQDTYNCGKVFEVFSKEGQVIAERLDNIEKEIDDNYDELSKEINDLREKEEDDVTRLKEDLETMEKNIPNLKRVVDINLQSDKDGVKTYLVEKQDGELKYIVIKDGEKGEKGDPFTYDDFTEDQLESLKVKGDKGDTGVGIVSVRQTQRSFIDKGDNVYEVTLSDGTVSNFVVRNGSGAGMAEDLQLQLEAEIARAKNAETSIKNDLNEYKESNNQALAEEILRSVTEDNRLQEEINKLSNKEELDIQDVLSQIDSRIEALIDGAPEALDTLKEIAEKLAENDSVASSILNLIIEEKENREAADKEIKNSITEFKESYESQYNDLLEKLLKEIADRENGDLTITNQLVLLSSIIEAVQDSVSAEALAREQADQKILDVIDQLKIEKDNEHKDLSDKIDAEIERATTKEELLSEDIITEQERATAAEENLLSKIDDEVNRAIEAEEDILNKIKQVESSVVNSDWDAEENEPGYIENKPLIYEEQVTVYNPPIEEPNYRRMHLNNYNGQYYFYSYYGWSITPPTIIIGETYVVHIDGKEYACVAQLKNGCAYLTNGEISDAYTYNLKDPKEGDFFIINYGYDPNNSYLYLLLYIYTEQTSAEDYYLTEYYISTPNKTLLDPELLPIKQNTGNNEDKIMSLKAVTDALDNLNASFVTKINTDIENIPIKAGDGKNSVVLRDTAIAYNIAEIALGQYNNSIKECSITGEAKFNYSTAGFELSETLLDGTFNDDINLCYASNGYYLSTTSSYSYVRFYFKNIESITFNLKKRNSRNFECAIGKIDQLSTITWIKNGNTVFITKNNITEEGEETVDTSAYIDNKEHYIDFWVYNTTGELYSVPYLNVTDVKGYNYDSTVFTIGNGVSESERSNIFQINKSGDIYILDTDVDNKPVIRLQDRLIETYVGETRTKIFDEEWENSFTLAYSNVYGAYLYNIAINGFIAGNKYAVVVNIGNDYEYEFSGSLFYYTYGSNTIRITSESNNTDSLLITLNQGYDDNNKYGNYQAISVLLYILKPDYDLNGKIPHVKVYAISNTRKIKPSYLPITQETGDSEELLMSLKAVTDALSNVSVDLSDYATTEYVDSKVDSIDLSEYIKKDGTSDQFVKGDGSLENASNLIIYDISNDTSRTKGSYITQDEATFWYKQSSIVLSLSTADARSTGQLAIPINNTNGIAWRNRFNSGDFTDWVRVLDTNNYFDLIKSNLFIIRYIYSTDDIDENNPNATASGYYCIKYIGTKENLPTNSEYVALLSMQHNYGNFLICSEINTNRWWVRSPIYGGGHSDWKELAYKDDITNAQSFSTLVQAEPATTQSTRMRANAQPTAVVEAGKQYYNDEENKVISEYNGFTATNQETKILSKYPIIFAGENVIVENNDITADYLMYSLRYMLISEEKYLIAVSVNTFTSNGGDGFDIVKDNDTTTLPSVEQEPIAEVENKGNIDKEPTDNMMPEDNIIVETPNIDSSDIIEEIKSEIHALTD